MRPGIRKALLILTMLFFGVVGFFIPLLAAKAILKVDSYVKWESIGSPPSGADRFYADTPYVVAENGNIYEYSYQDGEWAEASLKEAEDFKSAHSSQWIFRVTKPEGAVDYYKGELGFGFLYSTVMRDGTVMSDHEWGDDNSPTLRVVIVAITTALRIMGAIIGIGAGFVIFKLIIRVKARKSLKVSSQTKTIEEWQK